VLTICRTKTNVQQWLDTPSQIQGFSLKLKMEKIHQMIRTINT